MCIRDSSKIAAHAADIAKGIPHARDIDDKMGDARRVLDWDAQSVSYTHLDVYKRQSISRAARKAQHFL